MFGATALGGWYNHSTKFGEWYRSKGGGGWLAGWLAWRTYKMLPVIPLCLFGNLRLQVQEMPAARYILDDHGQNGPLLKKIILGWKP